jgi:hypothetical protein
MNGTAAVGIVISAIGLVPTLLAAGFSGWQATIARDQKDIAVEQTRLIQQQTVSAQEAAKQAKEALCRTLETGFKVIDLSRVTFLGGYTSPLTGEQQTEYKRELDAQTIFLKQLYGDNDCPPRAK